MFATKTSLSRTNKKERGILRNTWGKGRNNIIESTELLETEMAAAVIAISNEGRR